MATQAQAVKEQRLQMIKVEKSGTIEIMNPLLKRSEEWKTIEDIFAANWTIRQMVQTSEERVLLLLERDQPVPESRPKPF